LYENKKYGKGKTRLTKVTIESFFYFGSPTILSRVMQILETCSLIITYYYYNYLKKCPMTAAIFI